MFGIICGFRNLKREWKRYLLLIIELAVASVFACICGNVMFSYDEFVQWNGSLSTANLTEVSATVAKLNYNSGLKITVEDYMFFSQNYQHQTDFKIVYYVERLEDFYDSVGEVVKTVPVLYVNEEYAPVMLQSEKSISEGVMSEELRAFLQKDGIMPMGSCECEELLTAAPGKLEALEIGIEDYTRYTSYGVKKETAISYQDCVILPLSEYQQKENSMETAFLYLTADRELLYQNYSEILDYLFYQEDNLNEATGERNYYYSFENQLQGLERAHELDIGKYDMIFHYMMIGVGIIFINMCGILLLTVSRRKTDYALQLVVGAGRAQIYAGMLVEIGMVVFFGLLLGAVAGGYIVENGLLTVGFPVQNQTPTFLLLGLFALVLVLISSFPFAIALLKLEPAELLQ